MKEDEIRLVKGVMIAESSSEILMKHDDGKVERIKRNKIKKLVRFEEPEPMLMLANGTKVRARDVKPGDEILAYITNPGFSFHMGKKYKGFCLER